MSSVNNTMIATLNTARVQNNRYFTITIFIIGVIGSCLNVLVLSQPALNQAPTTRYFMAASGASLASLTSGLLARVMSGWAADPASHNTALCKFQAFVNKLGQTSCSYFILVASIDRWLQSSQNTRYRQMSSIKNSTRVIIMILIMFAIYHSIHVICYEAFLTSPPVKCYAGSTACRYFENLSYAFITIIIPHCFMLLIGWKTISNIRQSRRCIHTNINHNSVYNTNTSHSTEGVRTNRMVHRRKLRSLTRMLIIQVVAYIALTLPAAAEALYLTMTLEKKGSKDTDLQLAIDRFIFAFTTVLSYMAISLPFYLYTITGPIFRQTFMKILTTRHCYPTHH